MSLTPLLYLPLAYLSGSLPFAVWVAHWRKGIDIRSTGSGHATTTNVIRTLGFGWGALVLLLDIAKGFLPVFLALRSGAAAWPWAALTGVCAVAGHIWPLFAALRGGMGLATTSGALLALYPLSFPVALGTLIVLVLTLRHGARASVFAALLLPLVFAVLRFPASLVRFAVLDGALIAVRFASDWRRQYRELWLDRE